MKHLNEEDLIRIASMMESGVRAGRDWISILAWIARADHNPKVRSYLEEFLNRLKVDGAKNSLKDEGLKSRDPLWKLFTEILAQASRVNFQLSELLHTFQSVARSVVRLRRKERTLLFIPRFQSWMAIAISLGFAVGLPYIAPGVFPSFLSLQRYDFFMAGLSLILMGFVILHWLCAQPKRILSPLLSVTFFFNFLAIFVEAGLDLVSSWYRAIESSPLNKHLRDKLKRQGLTLESLDEFIEDLSQQLDGSWPEILVGFLWVKGSGQNVSNYFRGVADAEFERLMSLWEDRLGKLTLINLLPLGVLIMPGTLFLLIGPQLMEFLQSL